MHLTSNILLGLTSLSMVTASYVQQHQQQQTFSPSKEDPSDILTQHITAALNADQFCGPSQTYALYSKGRPITFIEGALLASNNNMTEPAAFTFTKTENGQHIIGHKNPWGTDFWWQDNVGRQYIGADSSKYEFFVRLAKNNDQTKKYLSIARGNRCLMFNDPGEGYMVAQTACEPLEFKQVPIWNDTWVDPTKWKNCVSDRVESEGSGLSAQIMPFGVDFRWTVCRIECSKEPTGTLCQECHSNGRY